MSKPVVILAAESHDGDGVTYDMSTPDNGEWLEVTNVPDELADIGR